MTRLFRVLEILWIIAALAALCVGLYHLISARTFDHMTYFPFIIAGLCLLLYYNLRRQRTFTEQHSSNKKKKS